MSVKEWEIVSVTKRKSGFEVTGSDGSSIDVHEDVLIRFGLHKGKVLSGQEIELLRQASNDQQAYADALRLLRHRPRTSGELRRRLTDKEYAGSTIDSVVHRLQQEGYVNDRSYASTYTDEKLRIQKKGRRMIRHELMQKGLEPEIVDQAIQSISREDEREAALALGRKRWANRKQGEDPRNSKLKVAQYLQRRGFSSETIRQVLTTIDNINDEYY